MTEVLSAEAPGVRITATPRGAHLLTWTTDGVERLWMSPLSGPDAPDAIRGGVPILFPQFGTFGPLGKHGFARTATWRAVPADEDPTRAMLAFELEDSDETRAAWPHHFHARVDISATATELEQVLTVTNHGSDLAPFTGGFHTYFAVSDPDAQIEGVDGTHAWDGASTERPAFTERLTGRLRALDSQDLIIAGAVAPLTLHDGELGRPRDLRRGVRPPGRLEPRPGAHPAGRRAGRRGAVRLHRDHLGDAHPPGRRQHLGGPAADHRPVANLLPKARCASEEGKHIAEREADRRWSLRCPASPASP